MTVESGPIGSEHLTIKAIAQQARDEIGMISEEINQAEKPFERAWRNLHFIDRIAKLPGVKSFLQAAECEVVILGSGLSGTATSLTVNREGLKLEYYARVKSKKEGWTVTRKGHDVYLMELMLEVDKDQLVLLWGGTHHDWQVVNRLADLKPERIIKKFEKAVSSPVRVS